MPEEIKSSIEIYEDVIKELCAFYENLGISENIVKVYETFRYMYMNGYLSRRKFRERIPTSFAELEYFIPIDVCGIVVFAGYGVCRHTTDFLEHIYKELYYWSSRLFVYVPDMKAFIDNRGKDFLTNDQAQKMIDEVIKEIDLYGTERQKVVKEFDGIIVTVEYFPSKDIRNHSVNVVKGKKEDRVYILDTRLHSVGDIIDEKQIILNNLGLTNVADVEQHPLSKYKSYYETDYDIGLMLINKYDTNVKQDVMSSIIYRDEVSKWVDEYKKFKARNQDRFDTVANNLQLAKRYLKRDGNNLL